MKIVLTDGWSNQPIEDDLDSNLLNSSEVVLQYDNKIKSLQDWSPKIP